MEKINEKVLRITRVSFYHRGNTKRHLSISLFNIYFRRQRLLQAFLLVIDLPVYFRLLYFIDFRFEC
jgi:hypothetical protein